MLIATNFFLRGEGFISAACGMTCLLSAFSIVMMCAKFLDASKHKTLEKVTYALFALFITGAVIGVIGGLIGFIISIWNE